MHEDSKWYLDIDDLKLINFQILSFLKLIYHRMPEIKNISIFMLKMIFLAHAVSQILPSFSQSPFLK